eukprot:5128359-Amphidinium_carterae.6
MLGTFGGTPRTIPIARLDDAITQLTDSQTTTVEQVSVEQAVTAWQCRIQGRSTAKRQTDKIGGITESILGQFRTGIGSGSTMDRRSPVDLVQFSSSSLVWKKPLPMQWTQLSPDVPHEDPADLGGLGQLVHSCYDYLASDHCSPLGEDQRNGMHLLQRGTVSRRDCFKFGLAIPVPSACTNLEGALQPSSLHSVGGMNAFAIRSFDNWFPKFKDLVREE